MGGSWLPCPWFLPPLSFGFWRWVPGSDRRLPLVSWEGMLGRGFLLLPQLSRGLLVASFLVLSGTRNIQRFYGRSFHISNSRPGSFYGRLFPAEVLLSGLPPYFPILSIVLRPFLLTVCLPCALVEGPFSGRPFAFLRLGSCSPQVFPAPLPASELSSFPPAAPLGRWLLGILHRRRIPPFNTRTAYLAPRLSLLGQFSPADFHQWLGRNY